MIFLRQHAEDPDRIIRIVIINRVRSHQATPFTVPQRTGAHGRPQASIPRTTSPARLTIVTGLVIRYRRNRHTAVLTLPRSHLAANGRVTVTIVDGFGQPQKRRSALMMA